MSGNPSSTNLYQAISMLFTGEPTYCFFLFSLFLAWYFTSCTQHKYILAKEYLYFHGSRLRIGDGFLLNFGRRLLSCWIFILQDSPESWRGMLF